MFAESNTMSSNTPLLRQDKQTMQALRIQQLKGYYILAIALASLFLTIIYYKETSFDFDHISVEIKDFIPSNQISYLVHSDNCAIPDLEVFGRDVKKFYKPNKYLKCSKKPLLTYVTKLNNVPYLIIDPNATKSYTSSNISCCYRYILRSPEQPDGDVSYTPCETFQHNVSLTDYMVSVRCHANSKKIIYSNIHAFTALSHVQEKISTLNNAPEPIKILLIGIDSVSRLNLRRALPLTNHYLEKNDWVEYQGYNKMGDNTFPNLMAVFTGRNQSDAYATCQPRNVTGMDNCDLLWYKFRKAGFITAYAEDAGPISTFNYQKKGFAKTPTDFYFRRYILAAEEISTVQKFGMPYCAGPETEGERILHLIKDFAVTFRNYSTFGVFWMNTFSHNDNNHPTMMDSKVRDFFVGMEHEGVFESSIVIFFSDHGLRFGNFRYTRTGWYEERLPFIKFWIPHWFRQKYRYKYSRLRMNYNKLTTPYDLYMTLQELLQVHDQNYTIEPSKGCPDCHSMFKLVSTSRSCESVSIPQHYCTCISYDPLEKDDQLVLKGSDFMLSQIESFINKTTFTNSSNNAKNTCAKYQLKEVVSASISKAKENYYNKKIRYLLLSIKTLPEAVFETTIMFSHDDTSKMALTGGISRLDSYAHHSNCTDDYDLKKYCYCN